jgi:hypothetical protein
MTNTKFSYPGSENRAKKVFQEAAKLHFVPAIITLLHNEWKWHTSCYGFALALKPYLGFPSVDLLFGNALFQSCKPGSYLYFLGLSWTKKSGFLKILFPYINEDFTAFVEHARSSCSATYYWYGGLFFMNDTVYSPSILLWDEFCDQRVQENPSSDIPTIDMNFRTSVIKAHKLTFIACYENQEAIIVVYQDHNRLGEIGVHPISKDVQRRLSHTTNIEEVVQFIEAALFITLDSSSVAHWLHKLSC